MVRNGVKYFLVYMTWLLHDLATPVVTYIVLTRSRTYSNMERGGVFNAPNLAEELVTLIDAGARVHCL